MTLTDFLLARVAEDEEYARFYLDGRSGRFHEARVLAECEAKRGAIEAAWQTEELLEEHYHLRSREKLEAANEQPDVVKHLATIYAAHPDYQDEWKP